MKTTNEIIEKFGNNVYTGTEWYMDTQNIEKRLREALDEQRAEMIKIIDNKKSVRSIVNRVLDDIIKKIKEL